MVRFLKKVAITGSLGSGKSTLCDILQELGAYVMNADQIVHQLLSLPLTTAYIQQIVKLLGNEVIVNDTIDRKKIAEIVFQSPVLLKKLEELLHPLVGDEIRKAYEKVKGEKKYTLFVCEIPLLFEVCDKDKNFELSWYDATICVLCDENQAKQRFMDKNRGTEADYIQRHNMQMNVREKAKRADFTIINNGTKEDLKNSAEALYQRLTAIPAT